MHTRVGSIAFRLGDDIVRGLTAQAGDESDTAGVVFEGRVVQPRRSGSEGGMQRVRH